MISSLMNCLGSYRHFHCEQTDALAVCMLARLSWPWVCCHCDIKKSLLQAARVPRCWQLGSVWNESRREGGKISKHEWSQLQSLKQFHMSAHYLRLCVCPSAFKFITCASACARGLKLLPTCSREINPLQDHLLASFISVLFSVLFLWSMCAASVCVPNPSGSEMFSNLPLLFSSLLPDW